MRAIKILGGLALLISLANTAGAQPDPLTVCQDVAQRDACAASCASACADTDFFLANTPFCAANGLQGGVLGAVMEGVSDSASCTAFSVAEDETDPSPAVVLAAEGEMSEECASLPTLSQRRICQTSAGRPTCAPSIARLENEARLMVRSIEVELAQFGNLLEQDWESIENREALCALTLAELDANYVSATEDPARLTRLQVNAGEMQQCHAEWQQYALNRASAAVNDDLNRQLADDSDAQMGPVAETMTALQVSVDTLRGAADAIVAIVDNHLIYCENDG